MLNAKLVEEINQQQNFEWYSSYVYYAIANYYAEQNLKGFANWFMIQTQEEKDHALLLNQYVLNAGGHVELGTVQAPNLKFSDFRTPLHTALEHELEVSARINALYGTAYDQRDFRTMQFLDWFVKEQGEEEGNTGELLGRFDLFGSDPKGLYMLDSELGARTYNPPSLVL